MSGRTIFLSHTSLMSRVPHSRSRVLNARGRTAKFCADPTGLVLEIPHTLREALAPPVPLDRPRQHLRWGAVNFTGREDELARPTDEVRQARHNGTALSFVGLR